MSSNGVLKGIGAVLVLGLALLCNGAAQAQFGVNLPGLARLPQNDFTWTWGDPGRGGRITDFSIKGDEAEFTCSLDGRLRPGSRLSRIDMRRLENDLRTSFYFIQDATNAMNALDQERQLEWAVLDCAKPKPREEREEEG